MIARVLWNRDRPEPAFVLSSAASILLACIALDDLAKVRVIPLPAAAWVYAFVTGLFSMLAIGPWVAPARRPQSARVVTADGSVRIGERVIHADDVVALSIVRGLRGLSIAIGRRDGVAFVEVDRDEDAVRIARALRRDPAMQDAVVPRGASKLLTAVQLASTVMLLILGPLYLMGALDVVAVGKEIGGIGGLIVSVIAMCTFVLRRVHKSQAGLLGRGAYAAHSALHQTNKAAVLAPRETGTPLTRGDEPVGAWLDRLDKLPANDRSAYRTLPRDVLLDVLSDDDAAPDERMGAARVLRKRYGEPAEIVRVVTDPEVRIRVEAAADGDVEEAEEKIERLGPLFRAR